MLKKITLAPGREKSLLRRHPWIFSRAVASADSSLTSGETCDVYDNHGTWLARAAYSPSSQIRARIWTFDRNEEINRDFLEKRIREAFRRREDLIARRELTAYRLIDAEADGIPGLIADVYGNFIVLEILSAGVEAMREELTVALTRVFPGYNIYERSDSDVRKKEGLTPQTGVISGIEPPDELEISENNGIKILVDIKRGHKTGYYLDQRDNRRSLMKHCKGKKVLNCFCYTGGFAIYALKGGASGVWNVDVSEPALELAKKNIMLNHLDIGRVKSVKADVFKFLRKMVEEDQTFDVIVLDPPKFIENKNHTQSGARGYKDINLLAFKLLSPGGILQTYSCSGHMTGDLFQKVVADAALDAGRQGSIIEHLYQAGDHPVALPCPETFYLKGLTIKAD